MSNDALWTLPPAPRCTPRPPETLWIVWRAGRQTECVLQSVGELGWDVRLLRDGSEFYGRRRMLRADAWAEAEELRRELERDN